MTIEIYIGIIYFWRYIYAKVYNHQRKCRLHIILIKIFYIESINFVSRIYILGY
jgi:hypothetical protein